MAHHNLAEADVSTIALESLLYQMLGPLTDMRGENIVIRDILPALQIPEHVITPILKLIDFGDALEITDPVARRNMVE